MIRMFVYVAMMLGLAFGVVLLMDVPGSVLITVGGYEFKLTIAKAVVLVLALVIVSMVLWSLLRTLLRLPSLISLSNRMRRKARGYTAVSRGLVSVGTGDPKLALRHARDAERFLGKEPLALLLKAQAAQLNGDKRAAEQMFTRMLDSQETRMLGLRGLYLEARRDANPLARRYVEEAYRAAPGSSWAGEAMIDYLTADRNWRDALAAVDESARRKTIDKETARRQKATLLAAAALEEAERNPDNAFVTATSALKLDPGLVPAAVLVARRHSARGDLSKATRVLETAWKQIQHPDLAEAYLGVRHGDSTADRLKRARHLAKLVAGAREGKMTVARAAIDARDFAAARDMLDQLVLEAPTARACRLMAELEDKESGNIGMVRKWLARASHAPRDPAWVADGYVAERWAPVSPLTGRIDAFRWQTPPQSLEGAVRAAIEADRMTEAAAPAEVAAPLPPPAEPAPVPETVVTSQTVVTPQAEPPAAPAPSEDAVPTVDETQQVLPPVSADVPAGPSAEAPPSTRPTVLSQLPDDPGPRKPEPKQKKRWSLMG